MADVLLARTDGIEGFERHVVVKRIRHEHARDQRFIQMFLDEARLAATLHHQNVVQVHDIGEASGEYFFAMEYIHGEDLRTILSAVSKSKTHMPLGYVVAIVSAAAAGLHYAHERRGADKKPLNIVHRDVSPSNIIVGYDGAVKVLDFGIAKAAMRQVETKSGSLKGKVSYMSPEQCKGDSSIDRRSDVYSLGVVLYELATTSRLFKGDNDYLLMDAIVNGKVPLPRVKRPDLPNDLSQIIMRALAVDPKKRYQTAEELRIALDQYAAKANTTSAMSALATYMHKVFGEKIEPWLDTSSTTVDSLAKPIDPEANTEAARNSWTEIPRDLGAAETAAGGASPTGDDAKTRTDGKRRRNSAPAAAVELATADTVPPPFRTETRTSTKMGWENQTPQPMPVAPAMKLSTKVALMGAPIAVALLGIGLWQFVLSDRASKPAAPQAAAMAAPAPAVAPVPPPPAVASAPPPAPAAAPAPAPASAAAPVAAVAPAPPPKPAIAAPATPLTDAKVAKPTTKKPAPAPVAAKAVTKAAPAVVVAAPSTPVPVPAAPAVAQTMPAPAPVPETPVQAEPVIPQLSSATVSAVASDHAKQLSKCENGTELHGDISITFQIDGNGKVKSSQMSSTIKNTKVAACILSAVRSWQFPRPPTGAAKGVYSINYQ